MGWDEPGHRGQGGPEFESRFYSFFARKPFLVCPRLRLAFLSQEAFPEVTSSPVPWCGGKGLGPFPCPASLSLRFRICGAGILGVGRGESLTALSGLIPFHARAEARRTECEMKSLPRPGVCHVPGLPQ